MNINYNNWAVCPECCGQGKIMRGPSRKRLRLYQEKLKTLNESTSDETLLKPLNKNLDICLPCVGSGLVKSSSITKVDSINYPNVAIIGGGIGGVAFAVACLHRGIPFTLYERDESFDIRSQGYGLTLQQASKAIEGLGILSLKGGLTSTRHVVHSSDGKVIGEWGLRKWKKEFLEKTSKRKNVHIARQSLRLALLEQLGEDTSIKWGHTLINYSENKTGNFDITFRVNGESKIVTADLLVGADGIRSCVRKLAIKDDDPLHYLGCIVILGICSLGSLHNVESSLFDSATVFQTVNGHERIYVMPYDNNNVMWQLSFPISEDSAKELSKKGAKAMKGEALARLKDWHDPIPQILEATQESDITGYPAYDRTLLDLRLLQSKGNITLIGDAAHPMSPFKGQGANQAILDALSLARRISTECGPGSKWREIGLRETVLTDFEKDMLERTASKVKDSAKAAQLLHSKAVLHEGDEPRGRGF